MVNVKGKIFPTKIIDGMERKYNHYETDEQREEAKRERNRISYSRHMREQRIHNAHCVLQKYLLLCDAEERDERINKLINEIAALRFTA